MNGNEEELKKTPLYEKHVSLGAKMVPFAGWMMPVQYKEGVLKEHESVRSHCGIFDISHMAEFMLEGPDAIPFLQSLMTNDLALLENNKAQYACMCYPNGTVVDDLFYYQESPEKIRIIANASNLAKDFKWMRDHKQNFEITLTDLSEQRTRYAFQGPKAEELLNPLVKMDLVNLKRFYFIHTIMTKDGEKMELFIARTGYTGEAGFEITCDNSHALKIFNALLDTGAKPIGLGARDSLRLEVCYSLYGHEINDSITPIEASLGWVVKSKEGIDYIGKEILLQQKKEGTDRVLVGLNLKDRGIMREHYKLFKGDEEIGYVTSGGFAPSLKKTIGLALVKKEYKTIGTEIEIQIRKKRLTAVVVKTPFFKK